MLFAGRYCQPEAWLKGVASPGDMILLYCRLRASLPGNMPDNLASNIHLIAEDSQRAMAERLGTQKETQRQAGQHNPASILACLSSTLLQGWQDLSGRHSNGRCTLDGQEVQQTAGTSRGLRSHSGSLHEPPTHLHPAFTSKLSKQPQHPPPPALMHSPQVQRRPRLQASRGGPLPCCTPSFYRLPRAPVAPTRHTRGRLTAPLGPWL